MVSRQDSNYTSGYPQKAHPTYKYESLESPPLSLLYHKMLYLDARMPKPIFYPSKEMGPDKLIMSQRSKAQQSMYTTNLTNIYCIDSTLSVYQYIALPVIHAI